ncbi:hypothetical protein E2C01_082136 [Portunus trituberculatus]|uniref:Uncharacterized protein n=1 Tax=Portunus trituberculatus TaxID=210409 RepID=A0A5B7J2Y1_PORTR|nr:hypothetical protein [Portunus trituberculatus]
MQRHHLISSS